MRIVMTWIHIAIIIMLITMIECLVSSLRWLFMAILPLEEQRLVVPPYQFPVQETLTTQLLHLRHPQSLVEMEVYHMKCIALMVIPAFLVE